MTRGSRFTPILTAGTILGAGCLGSRSAEGSDVPFSVRPPISVTADAARGLYAADLDGDGDQDVVSGSSNDDRIAWYENTAGDGSSFTTHTIAVTADNVFSVHAADVDGDGDRDVLSASLNDDTVAWYENTAGNGTAWTERTISTSADGASFVVAADVDGDGDADVVSASLFDDTIAWYENAAGNGSAWTERTVTLAADFAAGVQAADVDRDGDVDLVAASINDDTVAWFENTAGNGTAWTERTVSLLANGPTSVAAADVDRDGDLDLLSASENDDTIAWHENTAGNGSAWTMRTIASDADFATSVAVADLDGDGDLDALSASIEDDTVAWYENVAGDGSAWTPRPISLLANGAFSVLAADLDGDGDADVVSASFMDDTVGWFRNDSIHHSACFVTPPPVSTAPTGQRSVAPSDVDGDGDADAMTASNDDGSIAWHENAGGGSAWTRRIIGIASGAQQVAAADVDGDGDADALAAATLDGKLAWYENAVGDGTSWTVRTISTAPLLLAPRATLAADVDGDGDQDAVFASSVNDTVAWHENTAGNGSAWAPHVVTAAADSPVALFADDVDRDGDTDLLTASSNRVAWHENTAGDGSAWTLHTVGVASQASAVFGSDVDGDGDRDVISTSSPGNVSWHENTAGNGTAWTLHAIAGALPSPNSVFGADVDGDGDADALSASGGGALSWHENTAGNGSAWTLRTIAVDGQPFSAVASDVDADGSQDALCARALGTAVSWHRNRRGQFGLAATDIAPPTANNGALAAMLRIVATHLGRAGDHDLELASMSLLLEEVAGDPLTTAEANALVESLRVYRDANGNGVFDPSDVLAASVATLALSAGVQVLPLPDASPEAQISFGTPRSYFVVVELTATASQQSPNQLRVTHLGLGPSASSAEDRDFDIPLRAACPADVTSSIKQAVPVELFGFTVE